MALLALALIVGVVLATFAARSTAAQSPAPTRVVVVESGETLWTLATRHVPDQAPRDGAKMLRELNSLDGVGLRAGQSLRVPAGDAT